MPPHPHGPRTTHSAQGHTPKLPPVWGERADGPPPVTGGRAAQADRDDRAAWGVHLRSAYLSRIALPDSVAPGDVRTARAILERLEMALLEEGLWTRAERARLQGMREAWERRAGGRCVQFQTVGWVRRVMKGAGDRRRSDVDWGRTMQSMKEALEI